MLLSEFATKKDLLAWVSPNDIDGLREVVAGYDGHGRPVVTHTIEISGAEVAMGSAGVYASDHIVTHRAKGSITAMKSYALARVADIHFPFVTDWILHTDQGLAVDMTDKMPKLHGWMPGE